MKSGDLLTPLSIVLAFIGVIEATLAFRVTALSGTAQMIFVWFMVTFPALVLGGFFYIQITNPLSWYPPSELDRTTIERLQLLYGPGTKFLSTELLSEKERTRASTVGVQAALPVQADQLFQEGRVGEAVRLYEAALDAAKREGAAAEIAKTSLNLGVALSSQGKYDEALAAYERALATYRKIGDRRAEGLILNNIAGAYSNLGRYSEAENGYQQALAISRDTLGSDHPDTITTISNLASLYANTGRYDEAERLTQEALALSRNVLGEEHPRTAATLNNLAALYSRSGNAEEALKAYREALAILERSLGSTNPTTQLVRDNIESLESAPAKS